MGAPLALIRELDSKIEHSSADRRALMLRHLTDLFLVGAEQYSADEIALIDETFVRLVETIEESARALLSIRLAPVAKAPPKVLRLLACDDAIDVASAVLTQSEELDDRTLIECAMTKSQEHMFAISRRKILSVPLTDVLLERGDRHVVLSTAMNRGARFSRIGFGILVERARGDDALAGRVGARPDLPRPLFEKLLETASEAVRTKLEAEGHYARNDISGVVNDVATRIRSEAAVRTPQQAAAQVLVDSLNRAGKLNGAKLVEFVRAGRVKEIMAALALMTHMPIDIVEETMNDPHAEALLILAKAAGLSWETTRTIVASSGQDYGRSVGDIEKCRIVFQRLQQATAQQILAFHRTRARGDSAN